MKRQLYIIRHGKSSWDNEGLDDIDRPLNPRGLRSANMMAERLKRCRTCAGADLFQSGQQGTQHREDHAGCLGPGFIEA